MGDLFEVNTGSLLPNSVLVKGNMPRVSAKSENNGIIGYYDTENLPDARHFENFITVNFFGSEGGIFYHPYKASVEMKVHVLKPKDCLLNHKKALFLCSSLKTVLHGYDYGNQLSSSKLKNNDIKIKLPITQEGTPDYAFMESFIAELETERTAELETERTAELEAYLTTTGLKDTHLTPVEQTTLAQLETVQWGEFRLGDLFEHIKQGRRLKKSDQIKGNIPFVMAGTTNTGIANYIANPVASFPKNAITIDIFGNAFYRGYLFGAGDDTGVYWNTTKPYTHKAMLFLTTAINKTLQGKFDYGRKLRSSKSLNYKIKLPITQEGTPDYAFMESFIHAIQKVVIADVVTYTDQKIQAHKTVIQNHSC